MDSSRGILTRPHAIRSITYECRQRLQECAKSPGLNLNHWLDNRLSDFNLWDTGVGASARRSNSLDVRLEDDPPARDMIVSTIATLGAWVTKCRELSDLTTETPAESQSDFESRKDVGITLVGGSDDCPAEEATAESVVNGEDSTFYVKSNDRNETDITLEEAMESVQFLFKTLISLGLAIRKSGKVSRLRNADATFKADEYNDYIDGWKQSLSLAFLISVTCIRIKVPDKGRGDVYQLSVPLLSEAPELKNPWQAEQQILAMGNARRMHRFKIAKERRERLNIRGDDVSGYEPVTSDELQRGGHVAAPSGVALTVIDVSDQTQSRALETMISPAPSQSSMARSRQLSTFERGTPLAEEVDIQGSATAIGRRMNYPNPPQVPPNAAAFECPYCFLTLQKEQCQIDKWKKHLAEDLQPYGCYILSCPQQYCFFETFDEWKGHLLTSHTIFEGWTCVFCQLPKTYPERDVFTDHIVSNHGELMQKKDLNSIVTACEAYHALGLDVCPVCCVSAGSWKARRAQDKGFEPSAKGFDQHIGACLHSFALETFLLDDSGGSKDGNSGNSSLDKRCHADDSLKFDSEPEDSPKDDSEPEEWAPLSSKKSKKMKRETEIISNNLRNKLRAEMILSDDPSKRYIPYGALDRLLSEETVHENLESNQARFINVINNNVLLRFVCTRAKRLFAILVWSEMEELIENFYRRDFADDKLPVRLQLDEDKAFVDAFTIGPNELKPIDSHPFSDPNWTERAISHFSETDQWCFLSPTFRKDQFRYYFDERTHLPYMEQHPEREIESYLSIITRRRIHHDHLQIGESKVQASFDDHPLVAIKELKQTTLSDIEFREWAESKANSLELMRELNHPHLLQAFAHYTIGRKHFFMLPWAAKGSLGDLWKESPPTLSPRYLSWTFSELLGLADALTLLHGSFNGRGERHSGSLHPGKILCFDTRSTDGETKFYRLVIGNLGPSGRDFLKDSEGGWHPTSHFRGTRTYDPPEAELDQRQPRSRRWEVWSLGCIYLEFMIWLLYGCEELNNFKRDAVSHTTFYAFQQGSNLRQNNVELSSLVRKWIDWIIVDPRCTIRTAYRELLNLIETDLLVGIDSARGNYIHQSTSVLHDGTLVETPDGPVSAYPTIIRSTNAKEASRMRDDSLSQTRATAAEVKEKMNAIMEAANSSNMAWLNLDAPSPGGPRVYGSLLNPSDRLDLRVR